MLRNIVLALWLVTVGGLAGAPSPEVLQILPTSRVLVHVGKAGAFGFAGHSHEVEAPLTGSINLDRSDPTRSSVVLEFDAASLKVTGRGEPAGDVPQVQDVMQSRVLDVKRYPKIAFRSSRITTTASSAASLTVSVAGDLTLHGVTRAIVVPVRVGLAQGSLTAEGTLALKQTDFGIEPVTAAGGTVRVKDELEITFQLQAGE